MVSMTYEKLIHFLILFNSITISTVFSQFAIPLGPKLARLEGDDEVRGSYVEKVVDWNHLQVAATKTQARYTARAIRSIGHVHDRRWIATASLPKGMREVIDLDGQHIPTANSIGLLRPVVSDPASSSESDVRKATVFAKLGLSRGTRYIHDHGHGSHRFKKMKRPSTKTSERVQKLSDHRPSGSSLTKGQDRDTSKSMLTSYSPPPLVHRTKLIDSHSDQGDIEFYGRIQVGTPPRTFMMDFDTGSSDLWIKSLMCKMNCGRGSTNRHTYYDPGSSETSSSLNQTFTITYGVGGVSGVMYKDTVYVSGYKVEHQAFGSCDMLSEDWTNDPADGVMGMAFETLSTSHSKPWFDNAMAQNPSLSKDKTAQMFSFAMGRAASGSYTQSELYIGGQNAEKYRSAFQWAPLISKTYWRVKLEKVYCQNGLKPKFQIPMKPTTAIIDSGTTYIAASSDRAKAFWDSVPNSSTKAGDGFYTYPCEQPIRMTFDFGNGLELVVNELDINLGKVEPGSDRCVGAVFGGETGGDWILGIAFMKNYYTTFDFAGERIGFALPRYH